MSVWEKIHQAIAKNIEKEDEAFELAFLRFGETRKWLVEQINLCPDWRVLDRSQGDNKKAGSSLQ